MRFNHARTLAMTTSGSPAKILAKASYLGARLLQWPLWEVGVIRPSVDCTSIGGGAPCGERQCPHTGAGMRAA